MMENETLFTATSTQLDTILKDMSDKVIDVKDLKYTKEYLTVLKQVIDLRRSLRGGMIYG